MLWVAIIIVVVVIVLLLWWWLSRRPTAPATTYQPDRIQETADLTARGSEAEAAPIVATYEPPRVEEKADMATAEPGAAWVAPGAGVVEVPTPEPVAERHVELPQVVSEPPVTPLQPDDLTIVEGIGPKIPGLLRAEGIATFAQLAGTDVQRLRDIMLAAKLRIADPTTWPQQAALAADGKWDELKELQDSLKAGRRA